MKRLNERRQIMTDTATLAIFDPDMLGQRLNDDVDWWAMDFASLDEVVQGQISLIGLSADGFYDVRLTTGNLSNIEKNYATEVLTDLGIEIKSNNLAVTRGEELPGGGDLSITTKPMALENGKYQLTAYAIDVRQAVEDDVCDVDKQPVEIVILIKAREQAFTAPTEEPRFEWMHESYLFDEKPRETKKLIIGQLIKREPCESDATFVSKLKAKLCGLVKCDKA